MVWQKKNDLLSLLVQKVNVFNRTASDDVNGECISNIQSVVCFCDTRVLKF